MLSVLQNSRKPSILGPHSSLEPLELTEKSRHIRCVLLVPATDQAHIHIREVLPGHFELVLTESNPEGFAASIFPCTFLSTLSHVPEDMRGKHCMHEESRQKWSTRTESMPAFEPKVNCFLQMTSSCSFLEQIFVCSVFYLFPSKSGRPWVI